MAEIIRIPGEGEVVGGQFILGKEIGRGGYGVVFEALQTGVERKVAVKMLLPRALEEQEAMVDRFKREARLASSLKHPSAVTIYAFGVYNKTDDTESVGLPYIAMEYLEGESLQDRLLRTGPIPVEESESIIDDALGSLAEAHRKGIIHRDIKPDNIFLHQPEGEDRVVKVLDFGISMAVGQDWAEENRERLTATGLVTGTAEYMAPEQMLGTPQFTPAIDIYAMGCTGYQILTGRFPYHGSTPVEIAIRHIYDPVPDLPEDLMETRLGRTLVRAMNKDPRVRFGDAAEMLEALRSGEMAPLPVPAPATERDMPAIPNPSSIHAAPGAPQTGTDITVHAMSSAPTRIQPRLDAAPPPSQNNKIAIIAACALALVVVLGLGVWKLTSGGAAGDAASPIKATASPVSAPVNKEEAKATEAKAAEAPAKDAPKDPPAEDKAVAEKDEPAEAPKDAPASAEKAPEDNRAAVKSNNKTRPIRKAPAKVAEAEAPKKVDEAPEKTPEKAPEKAPEAPVAEKKAPEETTDNKPAPKVDVTASKAAEKSTTPQGGDKGAGAAANKPAPKNDKEPKKETPPAFDGF